MDKHDGILGALVIGVTLNTYLYGMLSCQYTRYHNKEFNDHWRTKLVVVFLLALDTFQSILMVYLCWIFLVTSFDNPKIFAAPQWPCAFIPVGTVVTASVTHAFLGARMFGLVKSKILFTCVIAMTLAEFGAGIALGIRMWTMQDVHSRFQALKPLLVPWLAFQMGIDIFISGFMSIFFWLHRTGVARTDKVVNRVMRGCIQTGAFSAILAVCGLVAFVARPRSVLYTMFIIPIGRTYTTTLMDTLNVRAELKQQLGEDRVPNAGSDAVWPRLSATQEATVGGRDNELSNLAFAHKMSMPSTEVIVSPFGVERR